MWPWDLHGTAVDTTIEIGTSQPSCLTFEVMYTILDSHLIGQKRLFLADVRRFAPNARTFQKTRRQAGACCQTKPSTLQLSSSSGKWFLSSNHVLQNIFPLCRLVGFPFPECGGSSFFRFHLALT